MLVRAFAIEVGADALAVARLDHEGVGRARIEPDVENVGDRLVIVEAVAVAEQGLMVGAEPGVGAALVEGVEDAAVDGRVLQIVAGLAVDVERDRHAPGALAADHPVGPPLDHRAHPVPRFLRHPAGLVDRLRARSRAALGSPAVHRDEPLRRAAVDDLGLGAPAMRIGVLEIGAGREQAAGLAQVRADRPVGRVELVVDHRALAAEPQPVVAILAVVGRPRRPDRSRPPCRPGNPPRHGRAPCGRGRCRRRW